jgi:hypothetical protein
MYRRSSYGDLQRQQLCGAHTKGPTLENVPLLKRPITKRPK